MLSRGNIDYVGTRLHAGMFALQHQVRTIILAIDNRTRDINASYHLQVVERSQIRKELAAKINSDFATAITIRQANIDKWLSQFD